MENSIRVSLLSKEKNKALLTHFAHLLPQKMTDVDSAWEFVGAFYDDVPCGILAYIVGDETIIPWIFVDEAYRRLLVGSYMIEFLKNELEEKMRFCGFSCEIILDSDGGGSDLIEFFSSIEDMEIAPKCCIYEVSASVYREAFDKHTLFKKPQDYEVKKYVELTKNQETNLRDNPKFSDYYQIDHMKKWKNGIDKELSLCIMEDGNVASAVFVSDVGKDRLSIDMLYSNGMKSLVSLLNALSQALIKKDDGKSLIFKAVNEKIMGLVEDIFSEIMVYGEVWEASTF